MTTTNPTTDLMQRSAAEQAALVRSGVLSARELVRAALAQIERMNPRVNAFVAVRAERRAGRGRHDPGRGPASAMRRAACLQGPARRHRELPTTHGSAAFGDWVADHDTAHVRRLREAGAIVVGKTNTPSSGCDR